MIDRSQLQAFLSFYHFTRCSLQSAWLQAKREPLKRAEIIEAARGAGLDNVVDNLYGKVMKDLCVSKAAQWTLKTGEPWEQ